LLSLIESFIFSIKPFDSGLLSLVVPIEIPKPLIKIIAQIIKIIFRMIVSPQTQYIKFYREFPYVGLWVIQVVIRVGHITQKNKALGW
jgi:hypothetical protein